MRGQRAKWIFGTDHAGHRHAAPGRAASSRRRARSREELGREAFVERVWEWRRGVRRQHHRASSSALGASLDYEDERFTMDDGLRARGDEGVRRTSTRRASSTATTTWSTGTPGLRTAISDLEVEQREVEDTLYEIDYPLESGSGAITVATVRPETMLADTAIAVNPDDERYSRPDRRDRDPAARRPPAADHRRRLRRPRVRHRRAEDHARPRPERLRDRAPARARGDHA